VSLQLITFAENTAVHTLTNVLLVASIS